MSNLKFHSLDDNAERAEFIQDSLTTNDFIIVACLIVHDFNLLPDFLDLADNQNIERNEIYMMSIMLNKLNEFGKKVQVDMVVCKVWQN